MASKSPHTENQSEAQLGPARRIGGAPTATPTVDPNSFARACAVRGVSGADLRRIGGFSKATLANIRAGRPVRPGTLLRLSATLGRFPVLEDLPDLVIVPARGDGRR